MVEEFRDWIFPFRFEFEDDDVIDARLDDVTRHVKRPLRPLAWPITADVHPVDEQLTFAERRG